MAVDDPIWIGLNGLTFRAAVGENGLPAIENPEGCRLLSAVLPTIRERLQQRWNGPAQCVSARQPDEIRGELHAEFCPVFKAYPFEFLHNEYLCYGKCEIPECECSGEDEGDDECSCDSADCTRQHSNIIFQEDEEPQIIEGVYLDEDDEEEFECDSDDE